MLETNEFKVTAESAPVGAESAPAGSPSVSTFLKRHVPSPIRLVDFLLLAASVAVADACLYWEAGGAGYAVAMIAWTLLFWSSAPAGRLRVNVLLLFGANLLLAFGAVWNLGFWNALLPVFFLTGLAVLTRSDHGRALDALLVGVFSTALGFFRLFGHVGFLFAALRRRQSAWILGTARYVIPTVAALILFLFFGLIFTWANPVIDEWVGWIFEHVWKLVERLLPDFTRLLLWGFVACIAAGLIRPFFARHAVFADERQAAPGPVSPAVDLGGLTALFALVTAVGLFFFYNAVDAVYLWGKASLPSGVTYSQYARQGAGWLTFALLASTLLIGAASAGFLRGYRGAPVIKGLSGIWILLGLVMAIGVLRRIHLYVGYNGLTPLRVTGIFGTLITAAGLLVMAVKIVAARNLAWVVRRYIAVFLAGVAVYAVFPEQAVCARWNTARAMQGNLAPLAWLFENREVNDNYRISAEALPGLVPLLDHPDPVVANGMAGYLFDELEHLEQRMTGRGWRGYQVTVANGRSALERVRGRLANDDVAVEALRKSVSPYR